MKTSTRRLLMPVALLGVLVGACENPNPQALLDEARITYAAGDDTTAMIQLKNLLRARPDHKEARLLRGKVALSLEDGPTAEKDFLRAEQLGVRRADIVIDLGKAMLLQRAFERVIAEIHHDSTSDERTRFEVMLLRGKAYLGLGKHDNARKAFRDALRLVPDSADARIGLARVALADGDTGGAFTELARAVAAGPDLPRVWIARGEVQLETGNAADAKTSFERALELKPVVQLKRAEFAALNGLFHAHLALEEPDQALAVAQRTLEIGQGHALAHYMLGQHAMHTGNVEDARTHLLRTLTSIPDHLGALSLMGTISLQQGKLQDAEYYLHQALAQDNRDPEVRMELARTMLRLNRGEDALTMLWPAMEQMGEVPELLALAGRAAAASKDRTEWLRYFEQAAATDPSDLEWQLQLGQAYVAAGMARKSIDLLERISVSPELADRRDLILVSAWRRLGEHESALEVADRLVERNPDDSGLHLMSGQLRLASNDLDGARRHLGIVLEQDRASIPALLTLGQVEIRAGNLDEAESLFRTAYTEQPDYLPTVTLLVGLAQSRGDNDAAVEWLEAARLTNPKSIMPRVGLVVLYLMQGDVTQAYKLAQEAVELQPDDPRALVALGITQIRREEYQQAIETLNDAYVLAPQSGMIQFELSRALYGAGKPKDARRALTRAVKLSPWRSNYAIAAARLDLSLGDAAQAGAIAEYLVRKNSADPVAHTLLGKSLMLQDRFMDAAEAFANAVETGQEESYVMLQYDALEKAGKADAYRVLADWLDKHPGDWRVRVLLAQAHHAGGRYDDAIAAYEAVLQQRPENTAVLNNLAWLYLDDDPDHALQLAKTVHRLEPHMPAFSDTLGWFLVRQGDMERGLRLLREAAHNAPDDGDIRYHLAAALAMNGEAEEARLLLTQLVNSGDSFGSLSEARALLQNL